MDDHTGWCMPKLPTTFVDELIPVPPEALDQAGQAALSGLNERGFGMYIGVRLIDLPEFRYIASQPSVSANCPEDLSRRFGREEQTRAWLELPGRLPFQFRKLGRTGLEDSVLAAYTWTRPGAYTEAPNCDNDYRFAIRVSEDFGNQGLGLLATNATISASMGLDPGRRKIALKTRATNSHAIKLYQKAGALLTDTLPEGGDASIFMRFPQTYDG